MKILNDYKEEIKYFINSKKYLITIIIVAILSYGFTVTHYSIGIDDLAFDRYVHGTYILSAKRWGTWLLYNVLQINEFTPFWLDAIVAIFMVIIAVVLCAFIRKQYKDKIGIWGYVIFSSLLISNPLINQFFIFQSTNLTIVVSNLITLICGIVIFENYFGENKKFINIVCGLILTIPISMYESCAQTYIVFLFITMFIKITQEKISNKKLFKYFCLSIMVLIIGIAVYFVTGKLLIYILEKNDILNKNFAYSKSFWTSEEFKEMSLIEKAEGFYEKTLLEIFVHIYEYLPVAVFAIMSVLTIVLECIKMIKTDKVSRMIMVLGTIFSNFILIFLLVAVLYRIQFSWIITTAFLGLYIYESFNSRRYLKYIIRLVAVMLIIIQTRTLNQYFYNDYKRYEKEKFVANDIAINVMKNCDYKNKPILCIANSKNVKKRYLINLDNGNSVMEWGAFAFEEYQIETTKFINEQGYEFLYITEEQAKEVYKMLRESDEEIRAEWITELDEVIVVNMDYYDFL